MFSLMVIYTSLVKNHFKHAWVVAHTFVHSHTPWPWFRSMHMSFPSQNIWIGVPLPPSYTFYMYIYTFPHTLFLYIHTLSSLTYYIHSHKFSKLHTHFPSYHILPFFYFESSFKLMSRFILQHLVKEERVTKKMTHEAKIKWLGFHDFFF